MSHKIEEGTLAQGIARLRLDFPQGLPGFESHCCFELCAMDASFGPFRVLASQDRRGPSFIVVQPRDVSVFVEVDVDSSYETLLGIESPEDVVVVLIVTPQGRYQCVEVNLAAPIVINIKTCRGAQVPQLQHNYPLAQTLEVPLVDLTR